ncbi:MAG: hypothetical protein CL814_07915 [Confluentimicrobium sp.]|jgi:hypothetical protein|uniref:HPt domain-containing protein n=1 Tax=Actibacterium naphthalenivorans TaxID=1614693 RepID=A0A840CCX9_9RHOB|nr:MULTISPECIES: hypothetical protein [Actibacterium]MBB4021388.1 hypothetical protein [Actibacterium naphthalenivorans]MBC56847.1 hypothetical protein [Actibacterium sp.]MDY6859604.1 hypothetical protein [Pseudomonadota bacterium]
MDPERLALLYVELGEARAQAAVARAMEDLAVTLERMKGYLRAGRSSGLVQGAHRICDIADPLGLSSLSRVAADVGEAAGAGDKVAQAATVARLERVAGRSLKMVWDLQDMSG